MALTNCGILFQQRTKEIISLLDKTEQDLAEQKSTVGGTVSIACVESAASHALPDLLGTIAPPIFTFLRSMNLSGKTVLEGVAVSGDNAGSRVVSRWLNRLDLI